VRLAFADALYLGGMKRVALDVDINNDRDEEKHVSLFL
jgi:hypothetical protein